MRDARRWGRLDRQRVSERGCGAAVDGSAVGSGGKNESRPSLRSVWQGVGDRRPDRSPIGCGQVIYVQYLEFDRKIGVPKIRDSEQENGVVRTIANAVACDGMRVGLGWLACGVVANDGGHRW